MRTHRTALSLSLVAGALACQSPSRSLAADYSAPPPAKPAAPAAAAEPTNGPGTVDDVEQALDRRDFATATKTASKLLALHGKAAEGMSRYHLFTLKADGQLGQKLPSAALDSLNLALKETTDPHELSLTRCTILLVKRSSGLNYVPKTTPPDGVKPGPIDITDRANRKAAFAALLDDELTTLKPKIRSAATAQSLLVIFPILLQVEDLQALDQIANGNDDKTNQITGSLVDHARTLMTTALKGMWQRVDDIDKYANQTTNLQQSYSGPSVMGGQQASVNQLQRKNGLTPTNKSQLQDIITTCDQIKQAAVAFGPSGSPDQNWAAITSDADRVAARANDVLNGNYSDMTNTSTYGDGGYGAYGNGYNQGYGTVMPGGVPVPTKTTNPPGTKMPPPTSRPSR